MTVADEIIQGYDPRTGEPAGEPVPATAPNEVDRAVARARSAAAPWARLERAVALEAVADALDAHTDELVELADRETALGAARLTGEVARTTGQLRLFAGVLGAGGYQDTVVERADGARPDLRRINRPIGPVAVFAASNFPFAFSVAGGDTASALAAGCPVVVKAHEAHPHTSLRTAELVRQALAGAGAPEGVFEIVFGFEAGVRLVRHPDIAGVGFTGSTRGGLALAKLCAERPDPIPFYGELGSVNPVVVLPGAVAARGTEIANGYAASLTLGSGQFCTNPGIIFVPEDQELLEAVAEAMSGTVGGPMLAERIHSGLVAGAQELAGVPGVRLLAEGKPGTGPWAPTPAVYTVTAEDFRQHAEALREEHFGPVGLVVTYQPGGADDPRRLLEGGSLGEGHLTATVHLDAEDEGDVEAARELLPELEQIAGRIVFNGWPTGVAVTHAQHHGGPYPATTAPAHTSVGSAAIRRWLVPVVYQDAPAALLPTALS
ncbi:aldehyde dehydrogenase (NADP(+)) [Actinospica robiniae]|uniref:aldehyde dehydrogenase (NADP(+)) n=1 Tax=Actinospica robiniae TaxID=304901 RepID=UPI00040ED35F|nr:aldehyde dehydrogenase (NADP(+)) [Actinospica robiniae]